MVKKLDLLPPDPEVHFNGRIVKPGFQFWLSLCSAPKALISKLDINIAHMIYVNYNAFMLGTNLETGKVEITHATDPNELLRIMGESVQD